MCSNNQQSTPLILSPQCVAILAGSLSQQPQSQSQQSQPPQSLKCVENEDNNMKKSVPFYISCSSSSFCCSPTPYFPLRLPAGLGEDFVSKVIALRETHIIHLNDSTSSSNHSTDSVVIVDLERKENDSHEQIFHPEEPTNVTLSPMQMDAINELVKLHIESTEKKVIDEKQEEQEKKDKSHAPTSNTTFSAHTNSSTHPIPSATQSLPVADPKSFTVVQLRQMCKDHKLLSTGNKPDLLKRLHEHHLL